MKTNIVLNGNAQLMNEDGSRNENYMPCVDSQYPMKSIKWLIDYINLTEGLSIMMSHPSAKEVTFDLELDVDGYTLWHKRFQIARSGTNLFFSIEFAVDDSDEYHTYELGGTSLAVTEDKPSSLFTSDCC